MTANVYEFQLRKREWVGLFDIESTDVSNSIKQAGTPKNMFLAQTRRTDS
jgi:hypothetical protein